MDYALVAGCDVNWMGVLWAFAWALSGANLLAIGWLISRELRRLRR